MVTTSKKTTKAVKTAKSRAANIDVCMAGVGYAQTRPPTPPQSKSPPTKSTAKSMVALPPTSLIGEAKARWRARVMRYCSKRARSYAEILLYGQATESQTRYLMRAMLTEGVLAKSGSRENTVYQTVDTSLVATR
jgi:predicted lipoprotein